MKKALCCAAFVLSSFLGGCAHRVYVAGPPPPPPLNYQAIEAQGDRDGFEAARNDVRTGAPPNFNRHPKFRNPPVPPPGFAAYRRGFGVGYNRFLHPGPGGPPPPPPGY